MKIFTFRNQLLMKMFYEKKAKFFWKKLASLAPFFFPAERKFKKIILLKKGFYWNFNAKKDHC